MNEPECISLNDLIDTTRALLESNRIEALTHLLNAVHIEPESLAPYRHFYDAHYTRNLVFKNDLFELLVLCWGIGHHSWIHNHRGQHCWMAVVEGTLAVRNYKRLGCDQQKRTVQLQSLPHFLISPGSAAKVDPDEPVHLVWNPPEFNRPAASVHVYSRPFDACVVYDVESGLCRDTTLHYTSEYGQLTNRHRAGGRLADLPACTCQLSTEERDIHCGIAP